MATANQTARNKFLEARKAGVDAVTARKEAYGDVLPAQAGGVVQTQPVAPVAGVPPATTTPTAQTPTAPIAPTPVVPQVTGVDGQKFTQAPVDTTTGLSAPIKPTPTVKTDITPGITQTEFQKAQAESEKIKAQNEAQMTLNNQQSELKAKERQQMSEEQRIANTPTDTKSILNALVSGVSVPEQNTPAYRIAQNRYKTYQKFATMTPTQLMDNMKMGEIDTSTSNLLASNPAYIQAKQEFEKFQKNQSINNMIKSVSGGVTGKTEELDYFQDASDAVEKKLGINETNAEAFSRIVANDPETVELTQTVSNIAKQLNTLNTERNTTYNELKAQYPTLSTSAMMTLMASRTQQTTDQISALNSSLSLVQADLKTAMEMAKMEYDATSQDIAMQAQLAGEERQMKNQLALSQAQFEQKIEQQAQLASDPTTATNQIIDTFAEMGIMADRSRQEIISDVQNKVANGIPLGQALSELQTAFKSKPLYKSMMDAQMRSLAPDTTQDWTKLDDTTLYNQKTGETKKVSASIASGYLASFSGDTTAYIASKEGFRAEAYDDATGKTLKAGDIPVGVPTIGYGTIRINGKPIQPGQTITQADAQALLNEDIAKHSNWKNFIDESTLSPSQRTALASFEYNLGPGIWNKSAMNIIDMIKSGDLEGAGREIQKYNKAGGKVIKGLQNRRAEEAQLLMNTGTGTTGTQDKQAEAMALVQGLGGTEGERANFAKNIINRANKKGISLIEAKKDLGYKTLDDRNFEETRKQQYVDMRKGYSESTGNAKTALTLLNQPQTAIGDVASVVGFLKTIDPASVARESEVESVENAKGIIDGLSNVFAKAKEGTKLTTTQRDQLKSAIQTIVDAQDKKFLETVYDMKKEFDTRGLDATVYIPKTFIDKAQKEFGKIEEMQSQKSAFMEQLNRIQKGLTDTLSSIPR